VEHQAQADLGTLHMADFLEAVRTRRQGACTMESGFESTATVQLGMVSYESETTVRWDHEKKQVVDNPAAAELLQRDYRKPWVHPYGNIQ
jgi:hypothetical protein